jgi:PPOX class probable F420-dependent enzyme
MTAQLISAQIRSFLAAPGRHAVIATINPSGVPWQSVIWYLLHDDGLLINSRLGRRWPSNVLRDPRVNFAVEDGENAVTISGRAEVFAEGQPAQEHIAEMARLYYDPELAERSIARYQTEPRVTFLIRPQRVYVHGDPR